MLDAADLALLRIREPITPTEVHLLDCLEAMLSYTVRLEQINADLRDELAGVEEENERLERQLNDGAPYSE